MEMSIPEEVINNIDYLAIRLGRSREDIWQDILEDLEDKLAIEERRAVQPERYWTQEELEQGLDQKH